MLGTIKDLRINTLSSLDLMTRGHPDAVPVASSVLTAAPFTQLGTWPCFSPLSCSLFLSLLRSKCLERYNPFLFSCSPLSRLQSASVPTTPVSPLSLSCPCPSELRSQSVIFSPHLTCSSAAFGTGNYACFIFLSLIFPAIIFSRSSPFFSIL